jgi:hypothetical protein
MKKVGNEKAVAVPTALYPEDMKYINRVGAGENFSQKLRGIIHEHKDIYEGIALYEPGNDEPVKITDGAVVAYHQSDDGQKAWGVIPFDFNKKDGYAKIPDAAAKNGYRCQVYENKETGLICIWLAPIHKKLKTCQQCKKLMIEMIEAA